jgi:hypothetical protein
MHRAITLVPLILLLAACSALGTPTPAEGGISGLVMLGPTCPVVREGVDCPLKPYQATMSVLNDRGKVVLQFETDEQGEFRVALAPGEYTLRPESPEGLPYPFADQIDFTVAPGAFTRLSVIYDSGIR